MALRELLAKFGFDVDTAPLDKGGKSVSNFADNLGGLASKFAGAAFLGGTAMFTQGLINLGDELDKSAARAGMSVEELQAWRFAADRSGASAEEFGAAAKILNKNMGEALGGGAIGQEFAKLGLQIKETSGEVRPAMDVLQDMADAVKAAKSPAEQTAIAMKFLGKGGAALLPLLKEGGPGIEKLTRRFKELGGGISEEFTKAAAEAKDAQTDLGMATTGLKDKLGVHLLPAVTWVASKLTDFVTGVAQATSGTNIMKVALGVLGGAAVIAALEFAPLLLEVLAIAIPLALLALLIEDVYTMFTGGHSAIGEFIDGMFGVGASAELVKTLTETWSDLVEVIKGVWPYLKFLGEQTVLFLKDMFNGFKGYGTMFEEFFHFVWRDIKKVFDDALNYLMDKVPGLKTVLGGLADGYKAIFGEGKPSQTTADKAAIATRKLQDAAPTDQVAYYGGPGAAGTGPVTQTNTTEIHVNGAGDPAAVAVKVAAVQGNQNQQNQNALAAVARP